MSMQPSIHIRTATRDDLDAIVAMLADDPLGAQREQYRHPLPASYHRAFDAIASDANNTLIVACLNDEVIGVLQITLLPYLTYQGGWRALIEGVRIHRDHRSMGLGQHMMTWAIDFAQSKGCHMVQLTTDKSRAQAKAFYEALGFTASHEGMKLHVTDG
jgi:ribosomal protein S18 acetylase RimI-like enzyme